MRDMEQFPAKMKVARKGAGLSLVEAAYAVRKHLPAADWVGYDVIRRIEAGITPEEKADPLLIKALARVYGVNCADLSLVAEAGVAMIEDLVRSRCWTATAA